MRACQFALIALVLSTLGGCGTLHNLNDRPVGPKFIGAGCCYPFGGTVRSGVLAVMGPPFGMVEVMNGNATLTKGEFGPGFKQVGQGMLITAAGLGAIVDTPLSLAGDLVTLPLVFARSKEYPWATWWGEKSLQIEPTIVPVPEDANRRADDSKAASD